jgi:5,10-methylenetetrahydrofolate reductase
MPDLPNVYTPEDRDDYLFQVPPSQRFLTVATCRYTPKTLAGSHFPKAEKILLVGGNEKTSDSLSTIEAAKILKDAYSGDNIKVELWGVTNPNDPNSIDLVEQKIEAGITGFLTQPLLSSQALDNLESYRRRRDDDESSSISFVAGMSMPRTAKGLQFWCKRLLKQPELLLESDPLFQAHLAFFSQPHSTSMAWIEQELENLSTRATIDGIHFMPLGNTEDLVTLFQRPLNEP